MYDDVLISKHFHEGEYRPYVFISYSHRDFDIVNRIHEALYNAGFNTWFDSKDMRAEYGHVEQIEKEISMCSLFLRCISSAYVDEKIGRYCQHEYEQAVSTGRNKTITIYVDDVSKSELNYTTGLDTSNIIGYKESFQKNFENNIADLINSPFLQDLKRNPDTFITCSMRLIARLKSHCEKSKNQIGYGYAEELHTELFPKILYKKTEFNSKDGNIPLYKYIISSQRKDRIVLLNGQGGAGKSVSMIETCMKLLDNNVLAIYVPLKVLGKSLDLNSYIFNNVLGGFQSLDAKEFEGNSRISFQDEFKKRVVIFLDGVNEMNDPDFVLFKSSIENSVISSEVYRNVQFVFSSRNDIPALKEKNILTIQNLQIDQIEEYLSKMEIEVPDSKSILDLICNPLLLTLYTNSDILLSEYYEIAKQKYDLYFFDELDNSTKIIHNYLITQLCKVSRDKRLDESTSFLLFSFILPMIASASVNYQSLSIKAVRDLLFRILDSDVKDKLYDKYLFFKIDSLRPKSLVPKQSVDSLVDDLLDYATKSFHFLIRDDDKYDFTHQEFRDFFAAMNLKNEVLILNEEIGRIDRFPIELSLMQPEEVLMYCSHILNEEKASPFKNEKGWIFPGKQAREASIYSPCEQLLTKLKEKNEISIMIRNLMWILQYSRCKVLAQCDFSRLDLTACVMTGTVFSVYYEDKIYSSIFDYSIMNKSFFILNGHKDTIRAITSDDKFIYSMDEYGDVFQWDMDLNGNLLFHYDDIVNELLVCQKRNELYIACSKEIIVFHLAEKRIIKSYINKNGNKQFRYLKEEKGKVYFAYDLEPFIWYEFETGFKQKSEFEFSIISGQAVKSPTNKQVAYHLLGKNIYVYNYEEKDFQHIRIDEKEINVFCLSYSIDGKQLLIGANQFLYILNIRESEIVISKRVEFEAYIHSISPLQDGSYVISSGSRLLILNDEFNAIRVSAKSSASSIRFISAVGEKIGNSIVNKYYVITNNSNLFELNHNLIVTRSTVLRHVKHEIKWIKDTKDNQLYLLLEKSKDYPLGRRFSFEKAEHFALGYYFKVIEPYNDPDVEFMVLNNRMILFSNKNVNRRLYFTCYSGIHIFGCSFIGVQGSILENLDILVQYGGNINGNN